VDEYFNIAEVCCSRWAREAGKPDAPERIAVSTHQTGDRAVFHTYFVQARKKHPKVLFSFKRPSRN
jgi:hypothetical protein